MRKNQPQVYSDRRALIVEAVLVLVAASCLSIYFTLPLSSHLGTHLSELGDSRLNAYIQAWGTHALVTDPRHLFDMNMYYPFKRTLAGSENLLGNQLFFAPAYLFFRNPALANNFVVLASFCLCASTMYVLVRSVMNSPEAAAVAGFIYGFALPRVAQINHMQLLSTQWIPLVILFLYRFLASKKRSDLIGMTICMGLQILCSLYLAYLAVIITASFFLSLLIVRRDLITRQATVSLAIATLVLLSLLAPIFRPYLRLQKEGTIDAKQQIDTMVASSASPVASYLDVNNLKNPYGKLLRSFYSSELDWEKHLFPGFVPILLSLIAIVYSRTCLRWRRQTAESTEHGLASLRPALFLGSAITTIIAYMLSLGPFLRINDRPTAIRLPMFWLRHIVPGMGSFRAPARFGFATLFGIAILASFGFLQLWKSFIEREKVPRPILKTLCIAILLLVMSFEFRATPVAMVPVMTPENIAPEYQWLAKQPHTTIIELPITYVGLYAVDPYEQAGYVYASTYHWQALVNGYTGYPPRDSYMTYNLAKELPSPTAVQSLNKLGVKYAIVHASNMRAEESQRWHLAAKMADVNETQTFADGTVVYELSSSSMPSTGASNTQADPKSPT